MRFLQSVANFWMALLLVALIVALVTLNFTAVGGLLLLIGIATPNYAKKRRQLLEKNSDKN